MQHIPLAYQCNMNIHICCCCDAQPASLHSIAMAAAILIDGCLHMSTRRAIAASRYAYDIFKDNFFHHALAATFTTSCVLTSKLPSGINSSLRRLPMMRCLHVDGRANRAPASSEYRQLKKSQCSFVCSAVRSATVAATRRKKSKRSTS